MKDYHINIFYSDEDEGYIADIPDLECCSAFGHTPEEALTELEKAKEAWLAAARGSGSPSLLPRIVPRSIKLFPESFGGEIDSAIALCGPAEFPYNRAMPKSKILIADDNVPNVELLEAYLDGLTARSPWPSTAATRWPRWPSFSPT